VIRKIFTLPDPILKEISKPVAAISPAVRNLAMDMIETMCRQKNCVGISAPQVGELLRIVIVDVSRHPKYNPSHGLVVLINPLITDFSDEKCIGREGCLSVPSLTGNVSRSTSITVQGLSLDEKSITFKAVGFEAIVFQHEIDHLDGLLFIDRVSSLNDVFRRRNI
jgi:peptide deformylase